MMYYPELERKIISWAVDRKIIPNAKPETQLMKAGSELGELFDAQIKGSRADIIDGAGDVVVCLIIYLHLHNLSLEDCLESAYNEIKDRKGTLTPEGLFVKEEK